MLLQLDSVLLVLLLVSSGHHANGIRLGGESSLRQLQGGPPGGGGGGGPPGGEGGGGGAASCSSSTAPAFMTPSVGGDCLTSFAQGTVSSYPEVRHKAVFLLLSMHTLLLAPRDQTSF